MSKIKVIAYKEGYLPRIYINPSDNLLLKLRTEGKVLINPNMGSVKSTPLAHTYPDIANNMVRPLPVKDIPEESELKSVAEKSAKPSIIDEFELRLKAERVHTHKLIIAYGLFAIDLYILLCEYGGLEWLTKMI